MGNQTSEALHRNNEAAKNRLIDEIAKSKGWPASHEFSVSIELSPELGELLGFTTHKHTITSENIRYPRIGDASPDLPIFRPPRPTKEIDLFKLSPTDILLHCSLLDGMHVGEKLLPMLQFIQLGDNAKGGHFDFEEVSWRKMDVKDFSRLTFHFTDLNGTAIGLRKQVHQPTVLQLVFACSK